MTVLYTLDINVQNGNIKHSARSCNVPPLTGKIPNNHRHRFLNSSVTKTDQEQKENTGIPISEVWS